MNLLSLSALWALKPVRFALGLLGALLAIVALVKIAPPAAHAALEHVREQGRAEVRAAWKADNLRALREQKTAQANLNTRIEGEATKAKTTIAKLKKDLRDARVKFSATDDPVGVWGAGLDELYASAGEPVIGRPWNSPDGTAWPATMARTAPLASLEPIRLPCERLGQFETGCRDLKADYASLLEFSYAQGVTMARDRAQIRGLLAITDATNEANKMTRETGDFTALKADGARPR
jgi:hypothetical protein